MTVTAAPRHERATSTRHGTGFWLIAAVFAVSMAFSTVPTPLYPIYQREDGFTPFTVTIVFAVYAVGVVTSLLLAGHISDWVGRRRVLLPALALEAVAAVLFLVWPALPGLLIARFVTGLGVGMITATATAYLLELHSAHKPNAGRGRFELVSAAANLGGLGAGTLVAGALAQFVDAPLRTPYLVFLVLLALSAVAVAATPETVIAPAVKPRYRPQRIRVAAADQAGYAVAAASAFAGFAVFGLFTSLAPSFVAGSLHHPGRLLAGVVVFLVFGAAAATQAASNALSPARRFTTGVVAQAAGLIVLGAGMQLSSLMLFLVGGAIAGGGAGLLFKSAVGAVAAMAAPEVRGEALAGLFLIAYLGLIGPALGLGIATRFLSATTAMLWFTGILLALLGATAATNRALRS
ncbi:MFS transporter [Actinoplanes friuliensis]|uniref:Putative MFS transporter n=1 Tax=Actinoplanes friuliensis DSM 7358 TaxID=1246995 RepID=U5VWK9_9ACTN|nr:MFS transporter [Actinoplanes friuliensis]AGZ40085.1 putative MFS transporter [Actinoplanes friuliensis DSM 7358]